MKWFDKWIEKKFHQQFQRNEERNMKMASGQMAIPKGLSIDRGPVVNQHGIRFTVHKATGGFVVETQMYDDNRDRNKTGLYVITNDKDIGQEIGKIITLESLKS